MPLDSQFCTLTFTQIDGNHAHVNVSQAGLRDPLYRRTRYRHPTAYLTTLDDPFCPSKVFGKVSSPTAAALDSCAHVDLVLYDPHVVTRLNNVSSATRRCRWSFMYACHEFRIRRTNALGIGPGSLIIESCATKEYRDDPAILCAQFEIRKDGVSCTMLDHNIARLRISDIKGLEILMILSFFFLTDLWTKEGHMVNFGSEKVRLAAFRDPRAELGDIEERERKAAMQRRDQVSAHARHNPLKRLFKRNKETALGSSADGQQVVTRSVVCH